MGVFYFGLGRADENPVRHDSWQEQAERAVRAIRVERGPSGTIYVLDGNLQSLWSHQNQNTAVCGIFIF